MNLPVVFTKTPTGGESMRVCKLLSWRPAGKKWHRVRKQGTAESKEKGAPRTTCWRKLFVDLTVEKCMQVFNSAGMSTESMYQQLKMMQGAEKRNILNAETQRQTDCIGKPTNYEMESPYYHTEMIGCGPTMAQCGWQIKIHPSKYGR